MAEGKPADDIDALRKAADREDATEKHAVTSGPILPAREILAGLLLDAARPADALREYEAVLKKEPNRLRATAGAALAAERGGDASRAPSASWAVSDTRPALMKQTGWKRAAALAALCLVVLPVQAVESDPLPVPADSTRAQAVRRYDEGVRVLLARDFTAARREFEAALKLDESLAEARASCGPHRRLRPQPPGGQAGRPAAEQFRHRVGRGGVHHAPHDASMARCIGYRSSGMMAFTPVAGASSARRCRPRRRCVRS